MKKNFNKIDLELLDSIINIRKDTDEPVKYCIMNKNTAKAIESQHRNEAKKQGYVVTTLSWPEKVAVGEEVKLDKEKDYYYKGIRFLFDDNLEFGDIVIV